MNTTESSKNEMIVYLPDSVSTSERRISFVVFSNKQAFQESRKYHAVNSRVVSVKVENLTTFTEEDVSKVQSSKYLKTTVTRMTQRNLKILYS